MVSPVPSPLMLAARMTTRQSGTDRTASSGARPRGGSPWCTGQDSSMRQCKPPLNGSAGRRCRRLSCLMAVGSRSPLRPVALRWSPPSLDPPITFQQRGKIPMRHLLVATGMLLLPTAGSTPREPNSMPWGEHGGDGPLRWPLLEAIHRPVEAQGPSDALTPKTPK